MTSIRHSDTPALERRRELVANELRLIDAELSRRREVAAEEYLRKRESYLLAEPEPLTERDLRSLGLI